MTDLSPTITNAGSVTIVTFPKNDDDFATMRAAESYLEERGFSVGRQQRGEPRGVLFGDFDIQKWRNLNARERAELHGTMTGEGRHGPLTVKLFATAPEAARIDIRLHQPSRVPA